MLETRKENAIRGDTSAVEFQTNFIVLFFILAVVVTTQARYDSVKHAYVDDYMERIYHARTESI